MELRDTKNMSKNKRKLSKAEQKDRNHDRILNLIIIIVVVGWITLGILIFREPVMDCHNETIYYSDMAKECFHNDLSMTICFIDQSEHSAFPEWMTFNTSYTADGTLSFTREVCTTR